MLRKSCFLIIGWFIASCTPTEQDKQVEKESVKSDSVTVKITKTDIYRDIMKEKNFQLEINGKCEDALDDTIHEKAIAYIDSKSYTDTSSIIEFKFIETCCQEFLGDYTIDQDTLNFRFEQVNESACPCTCWYKYKLPVKEKKGSFKHIKIEKKQRTL